MGCDRQTLIDWCVQGVFLGTGILSTCVSQAIFYQGGADHRTLLLPFCNYLGMMLVGALPMSLLGESKVVSVPRKDSGASSKESTSTPKEPGQILSVNLCIWLSVLFDFLGCLFSTTGLTMAGSGVYQVVYSSVVCWAALFSKCILKKSISKDEWKGIVVVTFGLACSALGQKSNLNHGDSSVVLLGVLSTTLGAMFYSANYVMGEFMMGVSGSDRPTPSKLCSKIGAICVAGIGLYEMLYTRPHWNELVREPIVEAHGSPEMILGFYGVITVSQLAHALTYYMLLGSLGAVSTGIMQSLRAVCVFLLSSLLYCSRQSSQCYSLMRGLSTLLVVVGVLYYSMAKGKRTGQEEAKKKDVVIGLGGGNIHHDFKV